MAHSLRPFLMFDGSAEEAMRFYVSLFRNSEIKRLDRYGPNELGVEGSVKLAEFTVAGQELMCIDSPAKHAFTFTPAISLFVECEDEAEMDSALKQLSVNGAVLMEPGDYGFSKKFAWINDHHGVSWQLNVR
jgi:predicted 3-demethylubiquinone-9 3-methyltransferase (glyoxalase superfamily)